MSNAMERRLARLEARKPRGEYWRDPFDPCMRLWVDLQAAIAGRARWIPRPEPSEPWSEETQEAFERPTREFDAMHRRLTADKPL